MGPQRRLSMFVGVAFAMASFALGPQAGSARAEMAAETPADIGAGEALADIAVALQLDALFGVLREEGLAYGTTLEADMFPGGGGLFWSEAVSAIYDIKTMRARFDAAFAAELNDQLQGDGPLVADAVAFFGSELGQRIVSLEIEARRAFLDTALEEAARVAADDRAGARDPLVRQLRRVIAAGDLLEMNVAAALSSNLAFMTGMSDSGLYGEGLPQDQILDDVWADEAALRDSSSLWLDAFLGLAYSPLTEAELDAYVLFVESPAGQRLNAALFAAYGAVYRQLSYDLGRAVGVAMLSRDI